MIPALPPTPVAPLRTSDDILGDIDRAHAALPPDAQAAISQAHGIMGLKPPATAAAAPTEAPLNGIKPPPMMTYGHPKGLIKPGNIDLTHLQSVPDPDRPGYHGTVFSSSSGDVNPGTETLYPGLVNGKFLSQGDGLKNAQDTGRNLGQFDTPENADIYAEQLHNEFGKIPGAAHRPIVGAPFPSSDYAPLDKISAPPTGGLPGIAAPPSTKPAPLGIAGLPRGGRESMQDATQSVPTIPDQIKSPNQGELDRLRSTSSGISQIKSPFARVPLQILDAIGRGLVPGIEMGLPGTSGHHDVLVHQAGQAVAQDTASEDAASKRALEEAQTHNQEAIPELKQATGDLAARKEGELETSHRNEEDIKRAKDEGVNATAAATRKANLASHGFKEEDGKIVPLGYEEMSEGQQAIHDLKTSQSEQADATAALKKAQAANQPAAIALAQARIVASQKLHDTAAERLGLSEKQFEMRAHGTEGGQALPGAMIGEDNKPVGTAFQQNIRPTGTQRDAAGRADTMVDLDQRIRKALQNPEIAKGTGPIEGRLSEIENRVGTLPHDLAELKNDLVSYGAFQAGLHPVRGIGALQYFDKVMGGLGQEPGELLGKLDSNLATAKKVQKVGQPHVQGGTEPGGAGGKVTLDGFEFPNQAAADAYKKEVGKK